MASIDTAVVGMSHPSKLSDVTECSQVVLITKQSSPRKQDKAGDSKTGGRGV